MAALVMLAFAHMATFGIGHARQNIGQLAFKLGEIEVAVGVDEHTVIQF